MRTAVCGDSCTGRRLGRAPPGYGSWAQILGLDEQCCLVTSDTGPFTVQLPSPPPHFRALAPLPHPTSCSPRFTPRRLQTRLWGPHEERLCRDHAPKVRGCPLRPAAGVWVQAQTSPRSFSAPGSRRGLSSPWRQSLPFLFLETREAATWKERRESPHGAAQVKGGGAQGTLKARTEGRKPGDNPFPSTCSGDTSSPGNPSSCSQPGEQRVWEARPGSESGGGGTQEGRRWGQGRAPACTSSLARMTESSMVLAPR